MAAVCRAGISGKSPVFRHLEQFHNSPYGVLRKGGHQGVYRELFEAGIARQVMKNLELTVLFDLACGPVLAVARDHIPAFIGLDDNLITRTIEACRDGIRR